MANFKPMLAAAIKDTAKLQYPLIASPKLDGIRCLITNRGAVSRSLKPIPNRWIQKTLSSPSAVMLLSGLDGELIVGSPTSDTVFNTTSSAVMSHDGEPAFYFYVFDDFSTPDFHFLSRRRRIHQAANHLGFIKEVQQYQVHDEQSLLSFEHQCLTEGYEGIMLRKVESTYKFGRSTLKEGHLMKLKRFEDGEAEVLKINRLLRNDNELKINELGQKSRSGKKSGLVEKELMGSIEVRDRKTGMVFEIGTGFTAAQRVWWWENVITLIMAKTIVKYKYQSVGVKDKPRFPVYLGIRDRRDM